MTLFAEHWLILIALLTLQKAGGSYSSGSRGPGPPCPEDFFKIMQFSGNFEGKNLFWANFGLRPRWAPWIPLTKILDPRLSSFSTTEPRRRFCADVDLISHVCHIHVLSAQDWCMGFVNVGNLSLTDSIPDAGPVGAPRLWVCWVTFCFLFCFPFFLLCFSLSLSVGVFWFWSVRCLFQFCLSVSYFQYHHFLGKKYWNWLAFSKQTFLIHIRPNVLSWPNNFSFRGTNFQREKNCCKLQIEPLSSEQSCILRDNGQYARHTHGRK